jgi:hypothetical protein
MLLINVIILACSACFLIKPKNTGSRTEPPVIAWILLHQVVIKKYSTAGSFGGIFSTEDSFFHIIPGIVKLTEKQLAQLTTSHLDKHMIGKP